MSNHHSTHHGGRLRKNRKFALLAFLVAMALLVYLGIKGSTRLWPETGCTISGSRVIRTVIRAGPHGAPVPMYRGEYQLRYQVRGHIYFVWAESTWLDTDREFVEGKVSSYASGPCEYLVRYNPVNPAEAVAQPR